MAAPAVTVNAYWDIANSGSTFVLDDPTRGVLDSVYVLAGDVAVNITSNVRTVAVKRGRSRELDVIEAGVASLWADNNTRQMDPAYTSSPYYGNVRPGKRVTISATASGFSARPILDGIVDDWNYNYDPAPDSTTTFDVIDGLGLLAAAEFDAWTTTPAETTGPRLTSILARSEVLFTGTTAFDVGTSTLAGDNVSWGSNVLNYMQLVAKADLGQLFAAKDNTITFYGRAKVLTGVGSLTFSDDGTGIAYRSLEVDYGTELLFNRVSVDATGFTKQTVSDTDSIAMYGVRTLSLSLPLDSAAQALTMATFLLNVYKQPAQRFSSMVVSLPPQTDAVQDSILALEIGSVIRVVFTPNKLGTAIDRYCLIEGISHDIGPMQHDVTFSMSNLANGLGGLPFVLDDATYGKLDGLGLLAY